MAHWCGNYSQSVDFTYEPEGADDSAPLVRPRLYSRRISNLSVAADSTATTGTSRLSTVHRYTQPVLSPIASEAAFSGMNASLSDEEDEDEDDRSRGIASVVIDGNSGGSGGGEEATDRGQGVSGRITTVIVDTRIVEQGKTHVRARVCESLSCSSFAALFVAVPRFYFSPIVHLHERTFCLPGPI
jgi:hypothetical protein